MTLDSKDRRLLRLLQSNARMSYADLGRALKLTPPAVADRMRRLEDKGVIRGYHAALDPGRLGVGLAVLIRIKVAPREYPRFHKLVEGTPELLQCFHVTGDDSFLLRAALEVASDLEVLVRRLSAFGETSTSLILSTVLDRPVAITS